MAFTKNFVFSDPVPAQQAVQYAQLAAQQQAAEDQAFNERMRNATQGRISQQNAQQQQMMNQYQMQQRQAENEKDRALERERLVNAQTVAGIAYGGRLGPVDARLKAQQDADAAALKRTDEENWITGNAYEQTVNNAAASKADPQVVKKMKESGYLYLGTDGLWHNKHKNPNAVELFNDIQKRVQGIPGSMGVGGRLPSSMDMAPSRARILQMGPPQQDFPSAPPGPSPFETPGFKVFRQSDFAPVAPDYIPEPYVPVDQPWMQPQY